MPIRFTVHEGSDYIFTIFEGLVTDHDLLNSYKEFYASGKWTPGMHELIHIKNGDASNVTVKGLRKLARMSEDLFRKNDAIPSKTAVYASNDLAYGLSRMYQSMIDRSSERMRVFRDYNEAKNWIEDVSCSWGD